MMTMNRRDLLRYFSMTAGCYVIAASAGSLTGCANTTLAPKQSIFPLGVASADPQPDAVILWTYAIGADRDAGMSLIVQVARDEAFLEIVAEADAEASEKWDHTVRVLVTGLQPSSVYYYRFVTMEGATSRTGRTRTAPPAGDLSALNVAVFSCQDYEQGFFTAYRRMMLDDIAAPEADRVHFILHVGDFIYETIRGPETVGEVDLNDQQVDLHNPDGSHRRCGPLPSGGAPGGRGWIVPATLEDYRSLYRTYLSDPDLQAARAWYPFVQTWDDHELLNDYWQSYYKGESIADLKVAANRAWFEYVPAALSVSDGNARDFVPVDVERADADTFDDNYLSQEPNNLAAISSMTIYRSVLWGAMAELLIIDGRSYRGPRGLPQELLTVGRHPYPSAPVNPDLIRTMNDGRLANSGNPPETIEFMGATINNPQRDAPRTSMLGGPQKAWLKSRLKTSTARWKLLGLNVGLMRYGFDSSFMEDGGKNWILWTDGWDGYPSERDELCSFIRDERISNVVSLTGDRHAHNAGLVSDKVDGPSPRPVLAEFACGAVSAPSRLIIQRTLSAHDPQQAELVWFEDTHSAPKIRPALNAWMVHGWRAAKSIAESASDSDVLSLSDPDVNPGLAYMDSDAFGYFVSRFRVDGCRTEFVVVPEPLAYGDPSDTLVRRRIKFELAGWNGDGKPVLSSSRVEGEPPLGGLKA